MKPRSQTHSARLSSPLQTGSYRTPWRSLLFVPGDDRGKLEKAASVGADAIIVDLEDGVGQEAKEEGRRNLARAAASLRSGGCGLVVRINPDWRSAILDIDAAIAASADAVMVPKVSDVHQLVVLREIIGEHQSEHSRNVAILPLIESPAALPHLAAIAACDGVIGLALGPEDYSLELGAEPNAFSLDLPCKLIAAAAFGKLALSAPISIALIDDSVAFRTALLQARQCGATGALCVHPRQVAISNEVFSPSAQQIGAAAKIVAAWTDAQAQDRSIINVDGVMVDAPVAARAEQLLALRRP